LKQAVNGGGDIVLDILEGAQVAGAVAQAAIVETQGRNTRRGRGPAPQTQRAPGFVEFFEQGRDDQDPTLRGWARRGGMAADTKQRPRGPFGTRASDILGG
jgi:hypothetical protein